MESLLTPAGSPLFIAQALAGVMFVTTFA